jgi:hypothetical protein
MSWKVFTQLMRVLFIATDFLSLFCNQEVANLAAVLPRIFSYLQSSWQPNSIIATDFLFSAI